MKAKKLMRDELRWLRKYRSLPSAKCRWQFRRLVEELIEVILEEARRPEGPDDDGGIPAPKPNLTVVQTIALVPRRSTALKHVAMSRHVPGVIARGVARRPSARCAMSAKTDKRRRRPKTFRLELTRFELFVVQDAVDDVENGWDARRLDAKRAALRRRLHALTGEPLEECPDIAASRLEREQQREREIENIRRALEGGAR